MENTQKTSNADISPQAVQGTTQAAPEVNPAVQKGDAQPAPTQEPPKTYKEKREERRLAARNVIDQALNPKSEESEPTQPEPNQSESSLGRESIQPGIPEKPIIEPKQEEAEGDDKFLQAFEKLSRREKELQSRTQEIKQMEMQVKQREAEISSLEELYKKAKEDPEAFLEHAGWDYDKLTRHKLESPSSREPDINPELEQLKKEQQEIKNQLQSKEQQEAEAKLNAAIYNVKQNISNEIQTKKDEYELCNIFGQEAVDIVYNTIDEYYTKHNEILSYEDALRATEDWYQKARLEPLRKSQKLNQLSTSKPESEQLTGQPVQQGQQASVTSETMTNALSATPPQGETRKLSRNERRELAKKALKWNDE